MANDKLTNSRSNAAPSVVNKKRTRFDLGGTRRFTCDTGDLVPFFCKEILPGDSFDLKTATLTRLETSLHQTLDNAYLEIAFFYVPNRIVFDDWDKLLGANDDPWARNTVVTTPQLNLYAGSGSPIVAPQSLLNHLMLPAGTYLTSAQWAGLTDQQKADASVTLLPLRAYFQIFNDWFRDENVDTIISFSKSFETRTLSGGFTFNSSFFSPLTDILKVNRFRDRFSSALPAPQKSAPVTFNLGGAAPVVAGAWHDHGSAGILLGTGGSASLNPGFAALAANSADSYKLGFAQKGVLPDATVIGTEPDGILNDPDVVPDSTVTTLKFSNLVADLTNATAITVNDLRLAIAAQVLSEQEARGGTRLTEVLFSQWNIKAPSLMLDRSEYLGGKRIPLQMLEVIQTSETTASYALGHEAGHGKTFDNSSGGALKSFMFHGYVLGLAFIRTARSYSQGIDRQFFRSDKYSYFNPIFDNIGEVPVYAKELFVPTFNSSDSSRATKFGQVFGYQEAWYEYKEGLNRDSGYMQTGIDGTVDTWHYGDSYTSLPLLSASWLKETKDNVNRTLAVQNATYAYQWSIMIDVDCYATRQMAKYSIPNTFGFGSK